MRFTRHYVETVSFHKISTPENYLKLRYFTQCLPNDIEETFIELNLRKVKWLLFATYHSPSQSGDTLFLSC